MALGALALVVARMAMTLREVRRAEQANFGFARIDELTGLRNRRAFFEEGEERFAARGPEERLGVIVMDLDGFKEINDTLGHAAGDELLRVVARRFASRSDGRGDIARIGGDEFAGTFEIDSVTEIVAIAQELAAMFSDPISIDGMTVRVGGSVGVALCPDHGLTQVDLLRCADVAMYEAKGEHASIRLYRPEDDVNCATGCGSSTTFAAPPGSATCSCTSSRPSTSRPERSSASRRSCAGATRPSGCSTRTTSSPCASAPA